MGSRSAHILRMPRISTGKAPPGPIYHQRTQSNEFWLRAATRTSFFTIGGLGRAPALLESLGIEEPQSRKIYRNGAWRQLSFLEQFRLVFANLLGAQAVGRTMEALREIFHYPDVTSYGSFGIITTLEIFQHHFSEMGHGTPPVAHTYIKTSSNQRSTT